LSQYASANVDLKYDGVQKLQDQSEDVIEMDFVFNDDPVNSPIFASRSRTLLFVNQATKLIDKIETFPLYEGDPKDTITEDIVFDDYRSVDGMLVPFHVSVFSDNKLSVELKLDNFKINVGLPDSDFELPKGGGQ
jgi:outer membrane lipoprotein-sorting protein